MLSSDVVCLRPYTLFLMQEEHRARDFFYALWVPDLFMERVHGDGQWSLFFPSEAPGLADCWGSEFERLYTKYEREVSPYFIHIYALLLMFLHVFRERQRRSLKHLSFGMKS